MEQSKPGAEWKGGGRSSWEEEEGGEGFKQSDLAGLHLFFYFLYIDV